MERKKVDSSAIAEIGYRDYVLEVLFRSGELQQYYYVSPEDYQKLMEAESIGKYFNLYIRTKYETTRRL